ncbi:NAD(P)-binding protein [Aestuariirhabdus sp. Z084]|uniref:NAD(P)/FAD-dependent oxidoreductase n=1 Tax=Aestuariirhabdus haliotis TaxID=2918751 RepID=UPI00201B3EC7|nr:FAD-dependent oxidoreductase [Aestuariirhabdus haliotis]MCL6414099.1 NAD(P)-binding protein [Aestuariirhabdus haliotis]MCL6418031.1 NAD(P)-binding protein [Aestuariirhabdus haliotis]
MITYDVAIIGAGTAGCFVAQTLSQQGHSVVIVEKSRGVGGRCSRRSVDPQGSVDLGAAGFRLQHPSLTEEVQHWHQSGWLAQWHHSLANFEQPLQHQGSELYCGVPSMNRWHRHLCQDATLITGQQVVQFDRQENHWQLQDKSGQTIVRAHWLIITAPARQTLALHDWPQDWQQWLEQSSQATQAQWVCAIELEQANPQLADRYTGQDPVLASAVRDSAKPGRDSSHERWVLQAQPEWTLERLDSQPDSAGEQLLQRFCATLKAKGNARVLSTHRWLLAQHPLPGLESRYLLDRKQQIGLCGDWLATDPELDGIESALLSAQALTNALLDGCKL